MKYAIVIFIIETMLIIRSHHHLIPPLHACVLAEICNHTRISVCGQEKKNSEHRIFHDECDMFELNCDGDREFVPVKYSFCSQNVQQNIYSSRRRYNGKFDKKNILRSMKRAMLKEAATKKLKRFVLKNQTIPTTDTFTTLPLLHPPHPCVVAEICNHTRIPVCGQQKKNSEHRIFHDDCDMFEFNCDGDREFVPVEFSFCSQQTDNMITENMYSNRRHIGNFDKEKILRSMKKAMLEKAATIKLKRFVLKNQTKPTRDAFTTLPLLAVTTTTITTTTTSTIPTSITHTTNSPRTNTPAAAAKASMSTIVLKRETVWKNGKLYMKVVKGLQSEYPSSNESLSN